MYHILLRLNQQHFVYQPHFALLTTVGTEPVDY